MSKILAADDDIHIRLLYSEELNEAGYEIVTTEIGERLLETIEEERPDLVILDIKMLDCSGLDVLQDIRKRFHGLSIIIATAYDDCKEDMRSIDADYYVVKSSDLSELKEKIRMALETKSYR